MPAKNVIKPYVQDGYYHLYNRGVEKRSIFLDDQDYHIFLYYLKVYLTPLDLLLKSEPLLPINLQRNNLATEIKLISYCLMPNHFHLLVRQTNHRSIVLLMRRLITAYTVYFNKKYERVGGLFQGVFRGALVENDELLVHISRYIHLNTIVSGLVKNLSLYRWSSYNDYLEQKSVLRCDKELVLSYFVKTSYEQFVEDQIEYATELEKIKHLVLDGVT